MKSTHAVVVLAVTMLLISFSGCVVAPGYPSNYAYGAPSVYLSPVVVQGRGYGYWYGGNFWGYRSGYSFCNGHYYHQNGGYNRGYGYGQNYGGYRRY